MAAFPLKGKPLRRQNDGNLSPKQHLKSFVQIASIVFAEAQEDLDTAETGDERRIKEHLETCGQARAPRCADWLKRQALAQTRAARAPGLGPAETTRRMTRT